MEVDLELGSEVGSNVQMRRECSQNLNNLRDKSVLRKIQSIQETMIAEFECYRVRIQPD